MTELRFTPFLAVLAYAYYLHPHPYFTWLIVSLVLFQQSYETNLLGDACLLVDLLQSLLTPLGWLIVYWRAEEQLLFYDWTTVVVWAGVIVQTIFCLGRWVLILPLKN